MVERMPSVLECGIPSPALERDREEREGSSAGGSDRQPGTHSL